MQLLTNHIGYEIDGKKTALIAGRSGESLSSDAALFLMKDTGAVSVGAPGPRTEVPGWKGRFFHTVDFSDIRRPGLYKLRLRDGDEIIETSPFKIEPGLLADTCI